MNAELEILPVMVSMVAGAESTNTLDADATEIVHRIRSGKWREPVEKIRAEFSRVLSETGGLKKAKTAVDTAKKKLPGVLWSGCFLNRKKPADKKLSTHSGLLCADLDNLGERLADVRAKFATSPHLFGLFTSPTGYGLKAVFRVPADREKHAANFRSVESHVFELTGEKIDGACKDVARLCFVSFDPDALLNENAVELLPLAESPKPAPVAAVVSNLPEIETRRRITGEMLGAIQWNTDTHGYCTCPGQHLHTSGNNERDCEIHLDKVPTVHCFHNSCAAILAGVNHELRSRIGKAERAGEMQPIKGESLSEDEKELHRLAGLSPIEYDRDRETAAEKLNCRVSVLDKMVLARKTSNTNNSTLQGRAVMLPDVEPWPEAVSGANVLAEIASTFARYVALPDGAANTLALWSAHAHCFQSFVCSPRLNISSPEKGCGKTTLRDVLTEFVPRPLPTENLSAPVLFRVIESRKPTVLADECDAWLRDNEELRGMLNAGHRRGGQALRCEGDSHEVRAFNVFAPAVLCGIGALPGTLHDRSIIVRLERAKPGELCQRFDSRHVEKEVELCRKLARWCADNLARLEACDPVLPSDAFNRLADNWRPLFAIAAVAGGDWPQRAADAFAKLTAKTDADAQGIGTMLLADIRRVFNEANAERMLSKTLVDTLCTMSDRPWPEANRGRPITPTWMAGRLRGFNVSSKTIRVGDERANGYELAHFQDAFDRYLPSLGMSKHDNVTIPYFTGANPAFQSVTDPAHVTDAEVDAPPTNIALSRCHASTSPADEKELVL